MKLVVLAVVAAAALAACSSSSGGAPSTSTSPPVSPPQLTVTVPRTSTVTVTTTAAGASSAATSSAGTSSQATSQATSPATSAAATSPTPHSSDPFPRACATSALRLAYATSDGAGGTSYTSYVLRNAGAARCTLFGYPGVSVLDPAGHIVQHPAERNQDLAPDHQPSRTVTLGPGAVARFVVSAVDTDPDAMCPGTRVGSRLQVYPPNQTAALILGGRSYQACQLHTSPVFRP